MLDGRACREIGDGEVEEVIVRSLYLSVRWLLFPGASLLVTEAVALQDVMREADQ